MLIRKEAKNTKTNCEAMALNEKEYQTNNSTQNTPLES